MLLGGAGVNGDGRRNVSVLQEASLAWEGAWMVDRLGGYFSLIVAESWRAIPSSFSTPRTVSPISNLRPEDLVITGQLRVRR